ncbi:ribokinase [Microvirga sp. KLBC 81]|uniref:ribokinase n=1 Tax=Microvirga sp. KLBC 81 TaxID=1862707 RepID=UPI000D519CD3|nr:ribokinase [Microvirga sp. KLBC 81]PVE23354.1 ribokinase [Microvirga sp. KLBC 81]
MILVFGSINVDLVARVVSIPRPGETVLSPGYATLFGGKGANQAIAAARASLPNRVAIAACVGDDAFGRSARDNLARNGVVADLVANSSEPTGCAFITVDERGENAITVASGANATLTEAPVRDFEVDASTVAVFQMEVPFPSSLNVARHVRAAGGRVIWNFAPAPTAFMARDLSDLINETDIFVVNEHEAIAAAALLGCETDNFEHAGAYLSRNGCICVVTAGARGAFAFHSDGRSEVVEAKPIRPVDTTGAGDTFVGILASGLDEALPLTTALQRACHGASLACLAYGAQAAMPTRAQLEAT